MSEPESFVARWSRRKRESTEAQDASTSVRVTGSPESNERRRAEPVPDAPKSADAAGSSAGAAPDSSGRPFDLSALPSLDSITAHTDIRSFLAPGVPTEIARAALRRAWSQDPAIRDFIGLAENAWDFNAAGAMPGFGPLEMTEEMRRLVSDILGRTQDGASGEPRADTGTDISVTIPKNEDAEGKAAPGAPTAVLAVAAPTGAAVAAAAGPLEEEQEGHAAPQEDREGHAGGPALKRAHGRALPK